MAVREDDVINPGGGRNLYGHVHFKNRAVAIVPLDDDGHTWLVGQDRYTLGECLCLYLCFSTNGSLVRSKYLTITHQNLASHDHRFHLVPAGGVDQVGQAILTTTDWEDFPTDFRQRSKLFSVMTGRLEDVDPP